jgi:hypothetical protein
MQPLNSETMPGADTFIGEGLGLAESVVGLINEGKANKEAKILAATRPKESASPYLQQDLDQAESDVSSGMGAQSTKIYNEGIDRTLSASLDAILKGGGTTNNIGAIFDNSVQGRQRLTLMNENIRLNNVDRLTRARTAKDEERQRLFEFNEWAPWSDKAQANAQARQGAQQQIWKGFDTAAGVAMRGAESDRSENQFDKYFQYTEDKDKPDNWYGKDTLETPTTGNVTNPLSPS